MGLVVQKQRLRFRGTTTPSAPSTLETRRGDRLHSGAHPCRPLAFSQGHLRRWGPIVLTLNSFYLRQN